METTELESKVMTNEDDKSLKIDGHAHVFLSSLKMQKNRRYTPSYDALPKAYIENLRAQGLDGALLVQPSFLGTDNSFLLNTLDSVSSTDPDLLIRGVVVLDPATTSDEMFALNKSGITGIRLNCISRSLPEFDSDLWASFLKRVEELNWHVELQIEGRRLKSVLNKLCETNSHVVIDHFGLPDLTTNIRCKGFDSLLKNTNSGVCVKLSAPYRVFPRLTIRQATQQCNALVQQLIDGIGTSRLIWGSDWPWTQHENSQNYTDCIEWGNHWYRDSGIEIGRAPDWLINPSSN